MNLITMYEFHCKHFWIWCTSNDIQWKHMDMLCDRDLAVVTSASVELTSLWTK
jgi:hypothetical protein